MSSCSFLELSGVLPGAWGHWAGAMQPPIKSYNHWWQEGAPKNPRAVGEAIQGALAASPAIKGTSIAGPGFVNLTLDDAWLATRVGAMLRDGIACWAPQLKARALNIIIRRGQARR